METIRELRQRKSFNWMQNDGDVYNKSQAAKLIAKHPNAAICILVCLVVVGLLINVFAIWFPIRSSVFSNISSGKTQQKRAFSDKAIYIFGGFSHNREYEAQVTNYVEKYDGTEPYSLIVSRLPSPRYRHTATSWGRYVYLIGGLRSNAVCFYSYLKKCFKTYIGHV